MPVTEKMLPASVLNWAGIMTAPAGALFFEVDANPVLLGYLPGTPGFPNLRFAVSIDSWAIDKLDGDFDSHRRGVWTDGLTFLVDPQSAKEGTKDKFMPGDLVTNGSTFAIVGKGLQGNATLVLLTATTVTDPMVAYRGWRALSSDGTPIVTKIFLP